MALPRLAVLAGALALVCAGPLPAAQTAEIAQEGARTHQLGQRVVQLWWLPVEYWEQAARELGWGDAEVVALRERLELYTVICVLDAQIDGYEFRFAEHLEIAERLEASLGGERLLALRRWDPLLTSRLPDLSYTLKVSLGPLGPGLRLLLFPNVDAAGRPALDGSRPGLLRVRYALGEGKEPLELFWRAPFTAIAGGRRDPTTGEPLEASWRFNPWTGEPVGPPAGAEGDPPPRPAPSSGAPASAPSEADRATTTR